MTTRTRRRPTTARTCPLGGNGTMPAARYLSDWRIPS